MYRFIALSSGSEIGCKALLIASGVSVRRLDVPGVDQLMGAGVYYGAALTEAQNYRGAHVFVVGGANSAGQAALFFSRYASKVTILVRSGSLGYGMSQYLVDQVERTPNIEVLLNTEVLEVCGQNHLEELLIVNRETGVECRVPAAAMFIFIGAVPHTDILGDLVERDAAGFILTGPDLLHSGKRPPGWPLKRDPYLLETSCPGVFAAGDVRHGSVKRVATAVGEGAVSIALVHQYLRSV
jgi:thioredoxin reductase (NADPH)